MVEKSVNRLAMILGALKANYLDCVMVGHLGILSAYLWGKKLGKMKGGL